MGLVIGVGFLARDKAEADEDEFALLREPYDALNALLRDVGQPEHHEPLDLADDQYFEAEMGGYGALHTVRRLAAHLAMGEGLPPPGDSDTAADDPVLAKLYDAHAQFDDGAPTGWLGKLAGRKPVQPKFRHLLDHSDSEGFYLPRDLDDVIFDTAEPPREGLGYMVGSSVRLLAECREVAAAIDLPQDMDPEADELWDHLDEPATDGPLWHRYGVEAFCLARLIRGCERSIKPAGRWSFRDGHHRPSSLTLIRDPSSGEAGGNAGLFLCGLVV